MTACPTPDERTRDLKGWRARMAPNIRNLAENYLAMTTTDAARRGASRVVEMFGHVSQKTRDTINLLAGNRARWDKMPVEDSWLHLTSLETHGTQDIIDRGIAQGMSRSQAETVAKNDFISTLIPELQRLHPKTDPAHIKAQAEFMGDELLFHKALSKAQLEREQAAGLKVEEERDYFPRMYKNVQKAQDWWDQKRIQLGATGFMKARKYELVKEAVEKGGLELKFPNPIDALTHRERSSIFAIEGVKMLRRMQLDGDAVPAKDAKKSQLGQDWSDFKVHGADQQDWRIRTDALNIVRNAFDHESLGAQGGPIGSVYEAMRQVKSVMMPINLGLTTFHLMHEIGFIGPAQALKRALQLSRKNGDWLGEYMKAGKLILLDPIINWPLEKIPYVGTMIDEATGRAFSQHPSRLVDKWQNMSPAERAADPTARAYVQFMAEGGASFTRPPLTGSHFWEDFKQDYKNGKLSMIPKGAMAVLEGIQKPLFNHFIPNMKKTQWMAEVHALATLHPEDFQNNNWRRQALQQITRNLDDRFGEMNYNNLIMNKIAKDVAVISMVSPSWNYGFARQMAGGAANMVREGLGRGTELQKQLMKTDDKAMFIAHYAGLTAAIAGLMTYFLTGKAPEGIDYIYARTGLTNANGTPGRLNIPSNFHDIPMFVGHMQQDNSAISGAAQLLWSKTILQPYLSLITGKDWKGGDMYDTDRPLIIRSLQLADNLLGETFKPAGFEAARRAGEVPKAGIREKTLAHAGFGPGPGYVDRTALQNRILKESQDQRGPQGYEYGPKTGLGSGLVQGAIRAAVGDRTPGEQVHEAQVALANAKAQGDAQGGYAANQALSAAGKSRGAIKYNDPTQSVEKAFAYLPLVRQQALAKGMTAKEFNQYVTQNKTFGDRKIKPNQQRLIKDRALP